MHTSAGILRRRPLLIVIPVILVLVFALSACGTNTTTTGSTPGTPTSTPAATATQGQTTAEGCPNTAVVATPPAAATITLTNANSGNTVKAKKGDTIEVNLAFGHTWQGPTDMTQNLLTVQGPAGYALASAKACVWRFVASGTGTAHLSFTGRPLCKKGQVCPMYIIAVPFTIDIS